MDKQGSIKSVSSLVKQSKKLMASDDEKTWKELCAVEVRRRRILTQNNMHFLVVLLHWDGTVIRLLSKDLLMWFTMLVYIGVRMQSRIGLPEFVQTVSGGNITVIGGFLSFFLVFFVVESNKRFFDQYNNSMQMKGRIFDVACLCKSILPAARGHRIVRYLNAAHIAGYTGLSDAYSTKNFFEEINKVSFFLSEKELIRMHEIDMDAGGAAHLELVTWALMDIQQAFTDGLMDAFQAEQMRQYVIEFRRGYSDIANAQDQPISFFYVHFIILLSSLYLPLFAVSAGYNAGTAGHIYWAADLIGGLIVWLQTIFVVGLRILGLVLQDPFGNDVEDLSVIHYVNFTWKGSFRILAGRKSEPFDIHCEEEIMLAKTGLGAAWDPISKSVAVEKDPAKADSDDFAENGESDVIVQFESFEMNISPKSEISPVK